MPLIDDTTIKAALTHPEPEVRQRAVRRLADSSHDDGSVMPLVIQAIERFGLTDAWPMLETARSLKQTPATIDWAIDHLRQPLNHDDVSQDNALYVLAWLVVEAEPALLSERYETLASLPALPEELHRVLDERLELARAGWATSWRRLEALGQETLDGDGITIEQHQRFRRLIDALAEHGRDVPEHEKTVLNLVRRQFPKAKRELYEQIEPYFFRLAGRMKLTRAIPVILRRLQEADEEDEVLYSGATLALAAYASDEVTRPLAAAWWDATNHARASMAEVLGHTPTDLAAERCLTFLQREDDEFTVQSLAQAALHQLNTDAVPVIAELVADNELVEADVEWLDVRVALVEAATIMGVTFPQYDEWYKQAGEGQWGWRQRVPPHRLRDGVQALMNTAADEDAWQDEPDLCWRLKVTLKGIDPPIWRKIELADCSLDELHAVIQHAFGWEDAHLYSFHVDDVEYTEPGMLEHIPAGNAADATDTWISEVVHKAGDRLRYIYDFGDNWEHEIVVEHVEEVDDIYFPPQCLDGARACPPEDVGGPPGYAHYLQAIADAHHPDHEDMLEWNGEFDPETFDREAVNAEFRRRFDAWLDEVTKDVDDANAMFDARDGYEDDDEEDEDDAASSQARDATPLTLADEQRARYPLGTVAMYGPDDKTTTKLVAGVITGPDAEPVLKRWVGTGVMNDERVQQQLRTFFELHRVQQVVVSEGNMGCPHEEGEDFPEGEDCPFCPYWRGRQ